MAFQANGTFRYVRVYRTERYDGVDYLAPGTYLTSEAAAARAIDFADVDGDGIIDLLIGTAAGEVLVHRGTISAGWFEWTPWRTLTRPGATAPVLALTAGDVATPATASHPDVDGSGWRRDGDVDVVASFADDALAYGWRGHGSAGLDAAPVRVGTLADDAARVGTLAVSRRTGQLVGLAVDGDRLFRTDGTELALEAVPISCPARGATVFESGAPRTPWGVIATCADGASADVVVAIPGAVRLGTPAEVDLGTQRARTVAAATEIPLDPIDSGGSDAGAVTISDVRIVGPDAADFELASPTSGVCREAETPSCTVAVRFAPRSRGPKEARLVIESDAYRPPSAPTEIALRGVGTGPVLAAPADVTAGDVPVGNRAITTMSLRNDGDEPLAIAGIALDDHADPGWSIEDSTCDRPVPAGETCTVTVAFAPTRPGAATARLRVASDTVEDAPVTNLIAHGLSAVIDTTPVALGDVRVGTRTTAAVAVKNVGSLPLTISSLALDGRDAARFALDPAACAAARLAPGERCDAHVAIMPAAPGALSAELRVESDAPGSPATIPLSATGVLDAVPVPALGGTGGRAAARLVLEAPRTLRARPGRTVGMRVRVHNRGRQVARNVAVLVRAGHGARLVPDRRRAARRRGRIQVGTVRPGRARTATARIRLDRRLRRGATVRIVVRATTGRRSGARAVIVVRVR